KEVYTGILRCPPLTLLQFKQRNFSLSDDEIKKFVDCLFNGQALLYANRDILQSTLGLRLEPALNIAIFVKNLNNQSRNLLYENVLEVVHHLKKLKQLPESMQNHAEIEEEDNSKFLITGTTGIENSESIVGTYINFYNLLHNHPETWYLVDGTGPMKYVQARTVVSVSPKSIQSNKFQELIKDPMIRFCVPPLSIEELLICKKIFPTVPQNLMLDLIDRVGGISRYCMFLNGQHA
ncbi:6892_t:CDS:2, partial [Dentiscutata heterogama]